MVAVASSTPDTSWDASVWLSDLRFRAVQERITELMKHASAKTLEQLDQLLTELRQMPGLVEREPGIFYRRSQAFLHFHEDVSGLFADAKLNGSTFERFCVSAPRQRRQFASAVREALRTRRD